MENLGKYLELLDKQKRERQMAMQGLGQISNENEANAHDYGDFVLEAGELLSAIAKKQEDLVEWMADEDDAREDIILHAQWYTYQELYNRIVELAAEKKGDE